VYSSTKASFRPTTVPTTHAVIAEITKKSVRRLSVLLRSYNNQCKRLLQPSILRFTNLRLIVRMTIIIVMNSLIRASRRSHIQIISQIDIQSLARTNIPCRRIRSVHTSNTPLQIVAAKLERAVSVLRLAERNTQAVVIDRPRLTYDSIEQLYRLPGCTDKLNQLPVHNLELACSCIIA
jgi:hypothetical protein